MVSLGGRDLILFVASGGADLGRRADFLTPRWGAASSFALRDVYEVSAADPAGRRSSCRRCLATGHDQAEKDFLHLLSRFPECEPHIYVVYTAVLYAVSDPLNYSVCVPPGKSFHPPHSTIARPSSSSEPAPPWSLRCRRRRRSPALCDVPRRRL